MRVDIFLLIILMAAAIWTVMTRSLLRSAIGLALSSVILAMLMYRLGAKLAAVVELSVCAGLIPVIFVSTISLTEPLTHKEVLQQMKQRLRRFYALPIMVIALGIILSLLRFPPPVTGISAEGIKDAPSVLWNLRQIDLLGQVVIILCGVFGVVILLKEEFKQ